MIGLSNITFIFRFPGDDLLSSFSVLSMRPLSFLTPQQLLTYGCKEIQLLCDYYGNAKTSSWKVDGELQNKTSNAVIDTDKTLEEWQLAKQVVVAEQYPREEMWKLWSLVVKYHASDFPNLLVLARLALTSAVHTAGCERGFSVQNRILTVFRNRLTTETQEQLMKIKLDKNTRSSFNFSAAMAKWKAAKDRRIYELK